VDEIGETLRAMRGGNGGVRGAAGGMRDRHWQAGEPTLAASVFTQEMKGRL